MTHELRGFAILATVLFATTANASSEEAWEAFRQEVGNGCRSLLEHPDAALVEVNPFGSEKFGVAILLVSQPEAPPERLVCIYDKTTGAAELTAPFGARVD